MKKNRGNRFVLGIFVVVGVFFFVVAIYYIGKKQQLFNNTFRISGFFKDVRGLQVGDNVRLAGINVGVVEDISIITDTTVKVDMLIDSDTRRFIRKNSGAMIGTDGLMGNKILMLTPGTSESPIVKDNDFIRTTMPVSMDDILVKLKLTGDNAATITSDLAVIMTNIRRGKGTIGKLFMDSTFAHNLDRTVVSLKQGATGFSQNMEAAKSSFLLKGIFKRKKRKQEQAAKEEENKQHP
jgi:phospholipid/cholesterol/gamma-HCH transport system substrate-binding protein